MYNKLFTKILDSSIWLENQPTRIVWVTFIACMDQDGTVALSSIGNVANRARVSLEEAEEAIRCLESPDAHNPDQDHDGRRIERIPGLGWSVFNAKKYRDIVTAETVRAQNRERQRRHRECVSNDDVTECHDVVTQRHENVTPSEAEAETKEKKRKEAASPPKPALTKTVQSMSFPIPRSDVEPVLWTQWLDMRRRLKKPLTQLGYDRLLRDLSSLIAFDLNDRLALAIDRKWQGLVFAEDKNGSNNGHRKSEREKSAERGYNAVALIDELRRQGQAVSGGDSGYNPQDAIVIESTESH